MELRDLDIAPADAALYQELAGALVYPHEALRASPAERLAVTRGQPRSGRRHLRRLADRARDRPRRRRLPSVRQLLAAHNYWRTKGIRSDLVILNAKPHSYPQELHDQLVTMAMASSEGGVLERPGGVFIRRADVLSADDTAAAARDGAHPRALRRRRPRRDRRGEYPQLRRAHASAATIAAANAVAERRRGRRRAAPVPRASPYANGYGGLTDTGDFAIGVAGELVPPAPWANVIANPAIGILRHRARRRIHVGGEQLLLPLDAVVQRSRVRPVRRGALSARSRERRRVDADARPSAGHRRPGARAGVHASRTRRARRGSLTRAPASRPS